MSATPTVPITPDLEALIRERIESGQYADEREVVWEALRVLDEQERLQRLRDALAIGLEQIERGEDVEYTPDIRARIWENAKVRAKEGRAPKPDVVP